MFIQGNLQLVFDALYNMGIIDPVLEQDWKSALDELPAYFENFYKAMSIVNSCQADMDELVERLKVFDQKTLGYVAMEVAREFADFHSRNELH